MAGIKHAFTNPKADGGDVTITRPSDWNADHSITGDVNFGYYKAVTLTCDNGATVPASPVAGTWFLHTPTGRKVLMQYDGSSWIPIISVGAMTIYVDNTDGTDSIDKGGAVDAGAVKTVQYAVNLIPGLVGGNVTININAETYAETVTIRGKQVTGDYRITLTGTLSSQKAGTIGAGSVQGSGGTQGTLVDNAGGMTVDAYKDMVIFEGTTNNEYLIIDTNSATTFTLAGGWGTGAPVNTNAYTVYDWGTIITGAVTVVSMDNVTLQDIEFTNSVGVGSSAAFIANRCSLDGSSFWYVTGAAATLNNIRLTSSGWLIMLVENAGTLSWVGGKVQAQADASHCIRAGKAGLVQLQGVVVDGTAGANKANYGVYITHQAIGIMALSGTINNWIRDCDVGIGADYGGEVENTAFVSYSGNTTNENANTTRYSYID